MTVLHMSHQPGSVLRDRAEVGKKTLLALGQEAQGDPGLGSARFQPC